MARTGDDLGYYYVEDYIEEGYIRYEPYIEDDYITANYFQEEGAVLEATAALSVSTTVTATAGRVQQANINLSGVFTPSILAVASRNGSIDMAAQTGFNANFVRTRSTDVTLDNIVNLSLQAARIRDNAMALAAAFAATSTVSRTRSTSSSLAVSFGHSAEPTRIKQLSADLTGTFSPTITATASLNGSIDLHNTASLSADVGVIKQLNVTLSSTFTLTADVLRDLNFGRPNNFVGYNYSTARPSATRWQTDNTVYDYVSNAASSYYLDYMIELEETSATAETVALAANFDSIDLDNDDFYLHVYHKQNDNSSTIADSTILSAGEGFNTVVDITGTPRYVNMDNTINFGYERQSDSVELPSVKIRKQNGDYITITATTSQVGSLTEIQNNFTLQRVGNQFSFYYGNILIGNETYGGNLYSDISQITLYNPEGNSNAAGPYPRFDAVTFRAGDTGPIRFPPNTDTAVLYHQFEQTLDDYVINFTLDATATLASTATLTASAGNTLDADADLTTTATITADVDKIIDVDADLTGAFSATATVDKIQQGASSIASAFTATATATKIQQGASDIATAFSQTAIVNLTAGANAAPSVAASITAQALNIKQLQSDLDAFVSTLVAAGRIGDFFIDIEPRATLSVDVIRTASGAASLSTTATITASADRTRSSASNLDATATTTATGDLVAGSIVDLSTTATLAATGIRAQGLIADLDSAFSATATGVTFLGTTTFEGSVTATIVCAVEVTRTTSADLTVTATQTTQGIKNVEANATLSGVFSPSITAVASVAGDIDLLATTTASIDAVKTTDTSTTASVQATLSADVGIIKQTTVGLVNTASVACAAGIQVDVSSSLSCAFTQTAIGTILDTTRYVYVVPKETRVFSINKETRTHTIHKETRKFTLGEL